MEKYNLEGPPILGRLPSPVPLSPAAFRKKMEAGSVVIDTSMPAAFGGAHIKRSYSIWLEGLSLFSGWTLKHDQSILLVLEDHSHLETAVRFLIRSGYDNVAGYLKGGIESWYNNGYPFESLPVLSVHELKQKIDSGAVQVLDVRSLEEWATGFIPGSIHMYVGYLEKHLDKVPRDKPVAVVCTVGHRAGIGASILLRAGFSQVYNVLGSVKAWKAAGFPLTTE